MKIWPGKPYPLGTNYDGGGTNFSLFSEAAERVELCLFDDQGRQTGVDLPEVTAFCWHGYLPEVMPGQRYGYRVHGPYEPDKGLRCNPAKLLLDPYAKAIAGRVEWNEAVFPYRFDDPEGAPNDGDSAPFMPKSVVIDPSFDWGDDRHPNTPWNETVVYEVHVKGFTARHPEVPEKLRGTYAGLAHPVMIEYLERLRVTAVELMPVHHFIHDAHLLEKGLRNYWGYNSIGYFAPHNEYAVSGELGQQVNEFKQMVKSLHQAGIEVILDVVYNHTAEGNHLGPVLSFKGIDNQAYYRLVADLGRGQGCGGECGIGGGRRAGCGLRALGHGRQQSCPIGEPGRRGQQADQEQRSRDAVERQGHEARLRRACDVDHDELSQQLGERGLGPAVFHAAG